MKIFEIILIAIVIFFLVPATLINKRMIFELRDQVEDLQKKNKEQDALIKALTGTDYELKEKYLFQVEPHRIND